MASGGVFSTKILEILAEQGRPLHVPELLRLSKVGVLDMSRALAAMSELGLVQVNRKNPDEDELVSLSPSGQRLVAQQR